MRWLRRLVVIPILFFAAGCGGAGEKDEYKNQDRPKYLESAEE